MKGRQKKEVKLNTHKGENTTKIKQKVIQKNTQHRNTEEAGFSIQAIKYKPKSNNEQKLHF